MTFPRPAGKPTFTAPWFKWFGQYLTMPEGSPWLWEGHTLLMTDEFFAEPLVHLLVVIPKSNQKTTWEAALAVWHLLTVKAPRAYCGAADKEQAQELFDFAAHFAESEPEIAARLFVRPSTKEIRMAAAPGRSAFKVLASDDSKQGGKKQGKNTTLWEIDELHAHENDSLLTDARSSGFKRREAARLAGDPLWWTVGKMATITTAGHDRESALGRLMEDFLGNPKAGKPPKGTVEAGLRVLPDGSVEKHLDGRLTVARFGKGRNTMLMWANREDDDLSDNAVVKLANPASTATVESIEDARESLTPWAFSRYRANVWTLGFESWIPVGSWDALAEPGLELQEGAETVAALDMARYSDCAALVAIQSRDEMPRAVRAWVWRPGGQDDPVPYSVVMDQIRALHERYDLKACAMDPKWSDQMAEILEGEGIAVEMFPQAQPLNEPVLTLRGWRPMGQLAVGDFVIGGDGQPTRVTGIHDHGLRPAYEVTFTDGARTRCSSDHFWLTATAQQRQHGRPGAVRPLHEIVDGGLRWGKQSTRFIPLVPVEMAPSVFPVDPYVLGVLLGDGCFKGRTTPRFTSIDLEIAERVRRSLPPDVEMTVARSGIHYSCSGGMRGRLNPLSAALRELGLYGLGGEDKFVPAPYFTGSMEQRLALLHGLMDTDGAAGRNAASFATTSPGLRDGVVALARSLGGVAHAGDVALKGKMKRPAWRVAVNLPQPLNPFWIERKAALVRERLKPPTRAMASIERKGQAPMRCITVAAEDGLYVTRDYIVTHNSPERMSQAAGFLRRDILEGNLAFNPADEFAPTLSAHVMAAVAKDVGPNAFRLDKSRKNGPDIDAAEALAMANVLARMEHGSMYDEEDATV